MVKTTILLFGERLTQIRKKKKIWEITTERDIKRLVFLVKKELEKMYYHRKLGYCITLEYWIEITLQI